MKRFLLILISFGWIPFIAEEARGCSCYEYDPPVCAAFWRADAVFAGQLLDNTPVEKQSDHEIRTVMLHFIVEQSFHGLTGDRVDVETLHGTSCDMKFEKGERYLIYASREQDNNQLFAGPDSHGQAYIYDGEKERVDVIYAAGGCQSIGERRNVQTGTVISIEVTPKSTVLVSELHLDRDKYHRQQEVHADSWANYQSLENGITMRTIMNNGCEEVRSIVYGPANGKYELALPLLKTHR